MPSYASSFLDSVVLYPPTHFASPVMSVPNLVLQPAFYGSPFLDVEALDVQVFVGGIRGGPTGQIAQGQYGVDKTNFKPGALAADGVGRAVMAAGFFGDAATFSEKTASAVIEPDRLVLPVDRYATFTPVGSFTSSVTYTGKHRRIGEDLDIWYDLLFSGAPNSVALTLQIPAGFTVKGSNLPGAGAAGTLVPLVCFGSIRDADGGPVPYPVHAFYDVDTNLIQVWRHGGSGAMAQLTQATPITIASGDRLALRLFIPVNP